mmetsp:Transcript_5140/g.12162  ORF Transcript_5140/g.12162 Transcript_5140/m.12162 type:complete len:365 (+) Transcript_5140:63-1157(+)
MLPFSPRPAGARFPEHAVPPRGLERSAVVQAPGAGSLLRWRRATESSPFFGEAAPLVPAVVGRPLCAAGLLLALAARPRRARRRPRGSRRPSGGEGRLCAAIICSARHSSEPEVEVRPEIRRVESAQRSFFLSQCPPEDPHLPEIAVFGRSNVGKSSLVNFLCGRKLLSTVSKHPGHTRLIHHFLVDQSWYLVDLPGIGYAEGRGRRLKAMNKVVASYVRHRSTLVELLYLVDGSIPPTALDVHGIKWLTDAGVYLSIVFTKTDKSPRGKEVRFRGPVEVFSEALMDMEESPWRLGVRELPQMFLTSSSQKTGKEALLEHVADLRRRAQPRYLALKRQRAGKDKKPGSRHGEKAAKPEAPPSIR